jgi:methionyl-tRNA formyltransferase
VTGHFIEPKIDSGLMIHQEIVPVYQEDNLTKIALRLLEIQPDILINSIKILETKSIKQLATFPQDVPYHTKMTPAQEQTAHNKFPLWLARYSNK